ncbi:MAG: AIR synthase-related protein, partial [Gordonia sp. (in: high G+C Gram-positive bacteria)]|uniref:AIR synthase-related protein n=1 Tax=Gordonia sp. (in: high G+C Gram-positive bacteria) TaxID=84139 RepID=UPI003BB71FFF
HDHLGGVPPEPDLERERVLAEIMVAGSRDGMISAAHDISEGGLIQSVVESALAGETGARLVLPAGADPFVTLFSESAGRMLVAVPRTEESRFCGMLDAREMPWVRIGVVDQGSDSVEIQDQFSVTLDELRQVHEATLPALFG